ncbi:hypothetical protein [Neobacillus sp. 114]|uniref:hypothetical protein n=1 Tax=Neobacillus sp. 114 TaxID=3048535 RepID=UPI0024C278B6|nr:hypothetical protein [Neobacillus sp. 114]
MNPVRMIQSFFNTESLQKASIATIKPGQLIYGRVEKLLPNNTAVVQIGNLKLYAHLKTALSDMNGHWFEVQANERDEIHLKVVEGDGQQLSQPSIQSLLKQLKLPETAINVNLLQFFSSKNLAFTKEHLIKAESWINKNTDFPKAAKAIEFMIKSGLPFTKQIFQSLVAVQNSESFYSQLEQAGVYLDDPKFASFNSIQQLKQRISTILRNHPIDAQNLQDLSKNIQLDSGLEVKRMLKYLIQSLGLEYEKDMKSWLKDHHPSSESLNSLKPLLMKAMTELGKNGKELEPILNRLTGMQLISHEFNEHVLQMIMQLPISFGEKKSDLTLQWTGRKTSKGQIDPHHCRILFFLDLQNIHLTVIDMQIQNKVVHVNIINDKKEMASVVTNFKQILKENLEKIGYQLSFIKVIPSFEKTKIDSLQMEPINSVIELYNGVDIKI